MEEGPITRRTFLAAAACVAGLAAVGVASSCSPEGVTRGVYVYDASLSSSWGYAVYTKEKDGVDQIDNVESVTNNSSVVAGYRLRGEARAYTLQDGKVSFKVSQGAQKTTTLVYDPKGPTLTDQGDKTEEYSLNASLTSKLMVRSLLRRRHR